MWFRIMAIATILSFAMVFGAVRAAAITAPPEPRITQAPRLQRRDSTATFGWYSAGETAGDTICKLVHLFQSYNTF